MNTAIQPYNATTQGFRPEQEEMLREPLQASSIKERKGFGGTMLKYIKADTAIDTANRIFGFGQWGYRVVGREHCAVEDDKKGKIEYYTCDIELSVVGSAFPFPGDGMGVVTYPYTIEMHEKARKEATSDALKRALRHYGDQFGLCLYNEDDYVDLGDGTLAKVKDVRPQSQGKQNSGRKIVDAPVQQPAKTRPQAQTEAPEQEQPEAPKVQAVRPKTQPAPQSTGKLLPGQFNALKTLYLRLNQEIPPDLGEWSFEQAAATIQGLQGQLKQAS